jgi:hypothetical protein
MAKSKAAKAEATVSQEQPAAQAAGLPLFFSAPRALESGRHAKATVAPGADYGFARATNSLPLDAIEFIEASKQYPIVFTGGAQPIPVAVVGLEQANYFVDKEGKWTTDAYIPAYVRQYPFVFFERAEEKKFYLCIDEAASNFSLEGTKEGAALYGENGQPSDLTKNALQFCTSYYNHHLITRNLMEDLTKHGLLAPYHSEATLNSGRKVSLSGFQIIDEKKLNALPDDVYLEFRKKGWLAFIYMALASITNWKMLVTKANTSLAN